MGAGYANLSADTKQNLQAIACLAYGSGKNEGKLGGEGRMGICDVNGKRRVIKFNTHWYERWARVSDADLEKMTTSSNSLRAELLEIAKACCGNSREGLEKLGRIKVALGYQNARGRSTRPKGLLDRKIVASVLTEIGGPELWKDALRNKGDMKSYATLPLEKANYKAVLSAVTDADTTHATEVKSITPWNRTWDDFKDKFKQKADEYFVTHPNAEVQEKVKTILEDNSFRNLVSDSLLNGVMSAEEQTSGQVEKNLEHSFARCLENLDKISARGEGARITAKTVADLLVSSDCYLNGRGYVFADKSDAESLQTIGLACDDFDAVVCTCAGHFNLDKNLVGKCVLKYITSAVQAGLLKSGDGATVMNQIRSGDCEVVRLLRLANGRNLPKSPEGQTPLLSTELHKALLAGRSFDEIVRLAGFLPELEKNRGEHALSPVVLGALLKNSKTLSWIQSENGRLTIADICKVLVPDETVSTADPLQAEEALNLENAIVNRVSSGTDLAKANLSAYVQTYGVHPDEAVKILSGRSAGKLLDRMKDDVRNLVKEKKSLKPRLNALLSNLEANLGGLLEAYAGICYGANRTKAECRRALEQILLRPEMSARRLKIVGDLCQIAPADFETKLNAARRGEPVRGPGSDSLKRLSDYVKDNNKRADVLRAAQTSLDGGFGWMKNLLQGDALLSVNDKIECSPRMALAGPGLTPLNAYPAYQQYRLTMLRVVQDAIGDGDIVREDVTGDALKKMLAGDFSMLGEEKQTKLLDRASSAIVRMLKENFAFAGEADFVMNTATPIESGNIPNARTTWFDGLAAIHIKAALRSNGGFKDAESLNEYVSGHLLDRNVPAHKALVLLGRAKGPFSDDELEQLSHEGFDLAKVLCADHRWTTSLGVELFKHIVMELRGQNVELKGREDEIISRMNTVWDNMDKDYEKLFSNTHEDQMLKSVYGPVYKIVCTQNPSANEEELKTRFHTVLGILEAVVNKISELTGNTNKAGIRTGMMSKLSGRRNQTELMNMISGINTEADANGVVEHMTGKFDKIMEVDRLFNEVANTLKNTPFDRPGLAGSLREMFNFDLAECLWSEKFSNDDKMHFDVEKMKTQLAERRAMIAYVEERFNGAAEDPARRVACRIAMRLLFTMGCRPPALNTTDDIDRLINYLVSCYSGANGLEGKINGFANVLADPNKSDADKAKVAFELLFNAVDPQGARDFMMSLPHVDYAADTAAAFLNACLESVLAENVEVGAGIKNLLERVKASPKGGLVKQLEDWTEAKGKELSPKIAGQEFTIQDKQKSFGLFKGFLVELGLCTAKEIEKISLCPNLK